MKIILLGAPGTGKGTQAEFISKKYGYPIISTGNILRKLITKKTPLGKRINKFITEGKLVSDSIIIDIICQETLKQKYNFGLILDGFPRTITQAQYLKKNGIKIDYVFEFVLSNIIIMKRTKQRRIDPITGITYNIENLKHCSHIKNLQTRLDDTNEIIKKRLKEYSAHSIDLTNFYMKEYNNNMLKYYKIDANNTIKEINDKIKNILK